MEWGYCVQAREHRDGGTPFRGASHRTSDPCRPLPPTALTLTGSTACWMVRLELHSLGSTSSTWKEKYAYWFVSISSYVISLVPSFPFYSNVCDLFIQQTNTYTMLFSVGYTHSTLNIG